MQPSSDEQGRPAGAGAIAACILEEIAWLYTTYLIPPEQASRIWELLAIESGVRTLGQTTDRLGRDVLAIAAPPQESGFGITTLVLLIDPTTGRMVGTETVTLATDYLDIDGPTVTAFTDAHLVAEVGRTCG